MSLESWDSPQGLRQVVREEGGRFYVQTGARRALDMFTADQLREEQQRDRANLAYRERNQAEAKAALQAEAEEEARLQTALAGFTDGLTPMHRAKVVSALTTMRRFDGVTRQIIDQVRDLVNAGSLVKPHPRDGRRLVGPDGSFLVEKDLSKTALNYAEYLIRQKEAAAKASWQLVRFAYKPPTGGWGMLFGVQTPDGWVYTDVTAFNLTGAWSPEEAGAWGVVDDEYRHNMDNARPGTKWHDRLEQARRIERTAERVIADGRRRRAEQQAGLDAYAHARQVETERQIDNPRDLTIGTVVESPGGDRYVARGFTGRGDLLLSPFLGSPDQEGVYPADRPLKGFAVLGTEDELRPVLVEDLEELAGGECSLPVANACAANLPVIRIGLPYGDRGRLLDEVVQLGAPTLLSVGSMFRGPRGEVTSTGFPTFQGFTPVGAAAWVTDSALDSAGFTAMLAGGYRWTPSDYVDFVVTNRGDGEMPFPWAWWSSMDYCVEPQIAKDREEVQRRMQLTVETYGEILDHLNHWRREGVTDVPDPMPILQGRLPEDYAWSARALAKEIDQHHECSCPFGGDCEAEWHREHAGLPVLVGLGSVCRRNVHGPDGLLAVLSALDKVLAPHVQLHLFGVKGDALAHIGPYKHRVRSIDSMAWDEAAKRTVQKARKAAGVLDVKPGEPGWISNTTENRAAHMRDWYETQREKAGGGAARSSKPRVLYFASREAQPTTHILHSAALVAETPTNDAPAEHVFRFPGGKVMSIARIAGVWYVSTTNPSTNARSGTEHPSYLAAVKAFEEATQIPVPAVQIEFAGEGRRRRKNLQAFDAHVLRGEAGDQLRKLRASSEWYPALRTVAGVGEYDLLGHPFVSRPVAPESPVDTEPTTGETPPMTEAVRQAEAYVRHARPKSYASKATFERASRDLLPLIEAAGLKDHLHLIELDGGRVVPVLVFALGEHVPSDVVQWAHAGITISAEQKIAPVYDNSEPPREKGKRATELPPEQVHAGLRKIVKGVAVGTGEKKLDALLGMDPKPKELAWDSRPEWNYQAETRDAYYAAREEWAARREASVQVVRAWTEERRRRAAAYLGIELPEVEAERKTWEYDNGFLPPKPSTSGWTCTACFEAHALNRVGATIVHHGYRRPGVGYIIGDCAGVGVVPLERGKGVLPGVLETQENRSKTLLGLLHDGWETHWVQTKEPMLDGRGHKIVHPISGKILYKTVEIDPSDPRWEEADAAARTKAQETLRYLWSEGFMSIPWLRAVLREWQPAAPGTNPVGPPKPTISDDDRAGSPL